MVVQVLLSRILGTHMPLADFVNRIGGPLSIGIPLAAVWAYYGQQLNRHIEAAGEAVRQAGMKRVYLYILSAIGLGGGFVGLALLIKFMIDRLTGGTLFMDDTLRASLANAIAVILAWLPLWLITWRRIQAEAVAAGDAGDHARRSVVRRGYLYLALFAGVIGGMISAVALVFELIKAGLAGHSEVGFLSTVLNDLQLLLLFAVLLVYHLVVLRRDGRGTALALAKRQESFRVLVFDSGQGFGESVRSALEKVAANIPVTVTAKRPRGKFDAMVLTGSRLLDAPVWVRLFSGTRIVVPDEAEGLLWAGGLAPELDQQGRSGGAPVGRRAGSGPAPRFVRLDGRGLRRGRPLRNRVDPDAGRSGCLFVRSLSRVMQGRAAAPSDAGNSDDILHHHPQKEG